MQIIQLIFSDYCVCVSIETEINNREEERDPIKMIFEWQKIKCIVNRKRNREK